MGYLGLDLLNTPREGDRERGSASREWVLHARESESEAHRCSPAAVGNGARGASFLLSFPRKRGIEDSPFPFLNEEQMENLRGGKK